MQGLHPSALRGQEGGVGGHQDQGKAQLVQPVCQGTGFLLGKDRYTMLRQIENKNLGLENQPGGQADIEPLCCSQGALQGTAAVVLLPKVGSAQMSQDIFT